MPDFIDEGSPEETHAFIQWKGTDVCMDFHCECGAHNHFDGYFAYTVKCQHCGAVWEMPHYLKPRKADQRTYEYWRENPQKLEPDEDHCDAEGSALPVPNGVRETGG
ncbi:hypothetical protein [Bradyrhizobium stylosanthis]|nr:hypothetical protein [Bradyrhizobium stylosanthis]